MTLYDTTCANEEPPETAGLDGSVSVPGRLSRCSTPAGAVELLNSDNAIYFHETVHIRAVRRLFLAKKENESEFSGEKVYEICKINPPALER